MWRPDCGTHVTVKAFASCHARRHRSKAPALLVGRCVTQLCVPVHTPAAAVSYLLQQLVVVDAPIGAAAHAPGIHGLHCMGVDAFKVGGPARAFSHARQVGAWRPAVPTAPRRLIAPRHAHDYGYLPRRQAATDLLVTSCSGIVVLSRRLRWCCHCAVCGRSRGRSSRVWTTHTLCERRRLTRKLVFPTRQQLASTCNRGGH